MQVMAYSPKIYLLKNDMLNSAKYDMQGAAKCRS